VSQAVVDEFAVDFVGNDEQIVGEGEFGDERDFFRGLHRSGGVIGIAEREGARFRADGGFEDFPGREVVPGGRFGGERFQRYADEGGEAVPRRRRRR
jgi:hypothetical protein